MADGHSFPLDGTKGAARIAMAIVGVLMTLFCGAVTLYVLLGCIVPFVCDGLWPTALLMLLPAAIAVWFTGFAALTLVRMYTRAVVSEEGVTLMRPLGKPRTYLWSDFQQVCICFASSVPRGPSSPVLCFVRHGEKKNIYDRWRTDMPWHYRRLIIADHTEAIEEAVRSVCPMAIADLRGTTAYSTK